MLCDGKDSFVVGSLSFELHDGSNKRQKSQVGK
jgi:hypothetical protein